MMTSDWSEIPKGIYLMRAFHEGPGKHILHLDWKVNDGPWYKQPPIPAVYTQDIPGYSEFWEWAEKNLPIWDYPEVIKNYRA